MVALAMHPAGNPDFLADIGSAQGAAAVGTVSVHDDDLPYAEENAMVRTKKTVSPGIMRNF